MIGAGGAGAPRVSLSLHVVSAHGGLQGDGLLIGQLTAPTASSQERIWEKLFGLF